MTITMKQATGTTATKIAGKKVLVKFNFTNPARIPAGIPEKARLNDFQIDHIHAQKAADMGNSELGQFGRVREGRVDTGEQMTPKNGLINTQVAIIRRSLAAKGFVLCALYYYKHEMTEPGRKAKFVVVLEFRESSTALTRVMRSSSEVVAAVRALSEMVWQFCHVWDNPDSSITVNLVGAQPEKFTPRHAVRVIDGQLVCVEVAEPVAEAEEGE